MSAVCHYCGDPVDPTKRNVWRRVIGWERKALSATRRGGSDIAGREPLNEHACDYCVSRLVRGLSPAQASFDD